jgi:hypothetical protein
MASPRKSASAIASSFDSRFRIGHKWADNFPGWQSMSEMAIYRQLRPRNNPTNSPRHPGSQLPPHNRQDREAKFLCVGVPG